MGRKEAKHQEKEPVGREKHRMRRFFERVKPFALTLVKENVNKKIANRKEQAEMKKIISLLMLLLLTTVTAMAQARLIGGTVRDGQSREALSLVTVQLLKTDSTYVKGATTDDNGRFTRKAPSDGTYIVKMTSVGYKPFTKRVTVSAQKHVDLGHVTLTESAIMLKGATIDGHAAKVVVKGDTFQYNASAYRVPEGSAIEELVKRLPGATVGDDGKITINGKQVKKILVDGKEFMTGDTQTAMKNLPTSIIEKVKAYDQKSDLSRITGIDDGEEETVLDFGVKKGMNKGFLSNVDLGIGSHNRYAERLMGGYFTDKVKTMIFGNANNTNDSGFPGGGGGRWGGGKQGLNASKMLGANLNYDDGKKLQLDGSVRWNHSNGDNHSVTSSENFVSQKGSFSNSVSQRYSRGNNWNANFRLEWKPDSMTNIMFRPSFSSSTSDGNSASQSASFNEDPYGYVTDPLSDEGIASLAEKELVVNRNKNRSVSYSDSKNAKAMVQVNRKLNSKGRNVTLRGEVGYNDSDSKSLSMQDVHLYQVKSLLNPEADSTYQTNRYNLTPTKKWNYNLRATYSEPIAKGLFLQFSYQYQYSHSKSDRSTFDFKNIGDQFWGINSLYRNWDSYLAFLGDTPLASFKDNALSRYSEYNTYTHQGDITLRLIRPKYQLNVGAMIQPQKTKFVQDYQNKYVDTTRTVTNFSPTLDFRYRFNKMSDLRLNYRGTTSQPSMTDLLDITDDSDPLNISKGNPGLKPSFTNSLRGSYNTFRQSYQQAIMAYVNYSNTRNSISSKVTYDDKTGGRTTRPENINGNWNVDGGLMFNTAIDSAGYFNVNTFTQVSYQNQVGYLSLSGTDSQKNTTRTTSLSERLAASYRNSWFEFELNGQLKFNHTRNLLQAQNNLDTWNFNYGANIGFTLPWGTGLNIDIHENSRRGYNDKSMNTNELIWNAQLSQSFLKDRTLSVMLQFYDILHNQSNFSRSITAMSRTDVQYNSINSYVMLHVNYRFNAFGGKAGRQERERGRNRDRQWGGRRGGGFRM